MGAPSLGGVSGDGPGPTLPLPLPPAAAIAPLPAPPRSHGDRTTEPGMRPERPRAAT